ncbi:MAG: zinc ribbon domain-containing protein, partial [Thermoguttaceae bacterium]|nr:zinc ribbon domain-containing protein [Thermoguttaceae bacterium]
MTSMRNDRPGVPIAGPHRPAAGPSARADDDGFDPYRALLNIREVQRPLDAYQLLRLKPFEEDPDSIRAAASLQRMALRLHRSDCPPEVWEQVRSELEKAISTLLDPDAKAAYDATLRVREATRAVTPRLTNDPPRKRSRSASRCPQCGAANSPTQRYCTHCGKNLWEACYRCGALNTASDKFCGACGADLVAGVEQEREEVASTLRRAEELRRRFEIDQAIALLRPVAEVEHSRLADLAGRAKALVEQWSAQRDRCRADADKARHAAERLLAEGKFRDAADAVMAVPAPFCDESLRHLLAEAESRLEEVAALTSQLRRAAGAPFKLELLRQATRLLELEPGHTEALAVIGRFRSRIMQMARAKLAERRYDEANRLLEHIPPIARTPEIETLHARTGELRWLAAELGTAPAVTRALLAMADRYRKLAPNDPQAAAC